VDVGILSGVKSLFSSEPATSPPPAETGYYSLTSFTPAGKPVKSNGEKILIRKPRSDYSALATLKAFILGRMMTDQEFLTGRMRADMDDEAPLANPFSQLAAVYACVRARAVPIAMVPLRVFEWKTNPKTGEEEKVEVEDHPLAEVFFNPNPFSSRYNLTEGTAASMSLNGNFYWYLDRDDPTQVPRSMWALPATRVKPIPDPITGLPKGKSLTSCGKWSTVSGGPIPHTSAVKAIGNRPAWREIRIGTPSVTTGPF
jgi:hypothetical protein